MPRLLVLSLLAGCAPPTVPPPSTPPDAAAPTATDPGPWELAAALDARTPVPLTPRMAEHQKANMRDHLAAVQEIVAGLGASDWGAVAAASARLGTSPEARMMCDHMGAGAPGFTERGLAFHATADHLGPAAAAQDPAAVLAALRDTLAACTGCHAAFRQQLVSDAQHPAGSAPHAP